MDRISPEKRSKLMKQVKAKNTTPELRVRKLLHAMGYRYRLHCKALPGKPDIVLQKHRLCIFVNGCFWHQHLGCPRATIPTSNTIFWKAKLTRTMDRDRQNIADLSKLGWRTLIVWECETKNTSQLRLILQQLNNRQ